jgi:radical SAM superfamily enzyme YgiQ (UPF0313 family)
MHIALIGAECEENLALRYIRAILERAGHTVTQIAFNSAADTETAARALAATAAPLAGVSMVFTYRAREFAALAQRARTLGYRGHLVAGGHFAAFNAEALLRDVPAFDSVAIGEGEELMANLAGHLDDLAAVCGLVWRDAAGNVHRNRPAMNPPDLDRLPPPTRLEPPDEYLGLPIANLLGSRGCSHACAFCSIAAWHKLCGGPRFRLREPEAVAAELAALYHRGYRIFNFHDDNFFLADTRASFQRYWRFGAELQRRGVGRIAFSVKSRPDSVDADLFAYLKELGLFRVFLGIEAGTPAALRALSRGQSLDDNCRALETVNRLGLHACFNLLLLNPDSTLEDFRAHVAFLRAHAGNPMNFCRTEVYAGTPLEARLRRQGRLRGDYWGYGYAIGDPRAQTVFELMYLGLAGRHFGDECVHHLTMRVDFERQLLAHFYQCPPRLDRQAKEFIRRVNLNSCDYLDELANRAAAGFADDEARQAYLHDLRRRVQRDNDRFHDRAEALLDTVHQRIVPCRVGWRADAAALLLASSVALAGTASCEMAPRPAGAAEPATAPADTETQTRRALLPIIALRLPQPAKVQVRAVFNSRGQLTSATVQTEQGETIRLPSLTGLLIGDADLKGKASEFAFTESEIAQAHTAAMTPPGNPPPLGDAKVIQPVLTERVARRLGGLLETPQDVEVELWFDAKGAVTYAMAYKAGVAHTTGVLTAADRERAQQMLAQLGAPAFRDRQAAQEALRQMGSKVLPLVREVHTKTTDPEVKERVTQLLEVLDDRLATTRLGEVLVLLRSQVYTNAPVAGKRFIATLPKQGVPVETHMFEMAPAPRD